MADHDDSAVEKGAKGAFEGVKGKAKEAVGSVVGNDELKREGEAQQDKADAQRDAAEKQTESRKADAAEARQKSNQH